MGHEFISISKDFSATRSYRNAPKSSIQATSALFISVSSGDISETAGYGGYPQEHVQALTVSHRPLGDHLTLPMLSYAFQYDERTGHVKALLRTSSSYKPSILSCTRTLLTALR